MCRLWWPVIKWRRTKWGLRLLAEEISWLAIFRSYEQTLASSTVSFFRPFFCFLAFGLCFDSPLFGSDSHFSSTGATPTQNSTMEIQVKITYSKIIGKEHNFVIWFHLAHPYTFISSTLLPNSVLLSNSPTSQTPSAVPTTQVKTPTRSTLPPLCQHERPR